MITTTLKAIHWKSIISVLLSLSVIILSGCSSWVYKTTGNTMHGVGQDLMMPYMFSSSDPRMACVSAEANAPLLLAFDRVDVAVDDLTIMMMLTAGMCEQNRAFEEELRYFRSLKRGDSIAAQDARSLQKSLLAAAARRQLAGYRAYEHYFAKANSTNSCPEFKNDHEELAWLLGNLVGVQAIFNDTASDMVVTVPRNVAAKAERSAKCLDNEKWWGLPLALRAAIWSAIPGSGPENTSPWDALAKASDIGALQGVRLADALWAMAAQGKGDIKQTKYVIRRHSNSIRSLSPNKDFLLFDKMATRMIEQMSDRLWTEHQGYRTPYNQLGQFWDDPSPNLAGETINVDDLL